VSTNRPFKMASIHGRFQPFHLAHFRYLERALEQADRVYIGLTRVLSEQGDGQTHAPHRFLSTENPLSYFGRQQLIWSVLEAEGIDRGRVDLGPFPIENLDRLPEFWPASLPCITTNDSTCNLFKIRELEQAGYQIVTVDVGEQGSFLSGTEIRRRIAAGDPSWKPYVPPHSGEIIQSFFE
jgi:cytidyltransferase-like protein